MPHQQNSCKRLGDGTEIGDFFAGHRPPTSPPQGV
jgi:hypothetical protein